MSKKTKKCVACTATKAVSKFNSNPRAKDGYLNTCTACWIAKVQAGKAKAKVMRDAGQMPPRKNKSKGKNGVDAANKALAKANVIKDEYLVTLGDGTKVVFRNRDKAMKQVIGWTLEGHQVDIYKKLSYRLDLHLEE